MAFKIVDGDNIRESFTSSGTTISLGGAVGTSRAFSAWLTSGDTFFGTARKGGEYSTGLFTYTSGSPGSIAQTEVWVSSNSNAAVSFSSGGTGEIFHDPPARIFDNLNLRPITVTSAATFDIGAAQGVRILSSGTTGPVTSFGTGKNKLRIVTWSGATLTCNTTSLILIGLANGATRVTAAGDIGVYTSDNSGNWTEISYTYASGKVLSPVDGTAALPAYSWASDTDSGFYRIGANNIGAAVNGAKVLDISTTGLGVTGTVLSSDGAVSAPAYSFTSDPDTGLYRIGANNIGIAANGAKVLDIATTGLGVTGTLTSSGALSVTDSTAAVSTVTGSGKFGGGIGVVGAGYFGSIVSAIGLRTPVTTGTTPALDASGQTVLSVAGSGASGTIAAGGGYHLISVAEVSSTGNTAVFICGNGSVALLGQASGSSWVAGTSPGAGFSLGYSSGYKIYNGTGTSKNFAAVVLTIS